MKYPKGFCRPDLVEKLMEEVDPRIVWLHFAGEPTLHPRLPELAELCDDRAALVTNGSLLTPELSLSLLEAEVRWIVVSVVGATPATYRLVSGLDIHEVRRNSVELWRLKRDGGFRTRITNRVIVTHENRHELNEMRRLWRTTCDDLHIVHEFRVPRLDRPAYRRPRLNCLLKLKLENEACVKWDGGVVPCCNDLDGWHVLGDASRQRLDEIRAGDAFRRFREAVASPDPPAICRSCGAAPSPLFRALWRRLR